MGSEIIKITPDTAEVTEKEARYGFLQLSEAEFGEALKSGRYPDPERYRKLTEYYPEPHEPGWKGVSLAEMFPTRYKDLLKRGVPDKLSPSEVKTVIEEKRIPYGRGVELDIKEDIESMVYSFNPCESVFSFQLAELVRMNKLYGDIEELYHTKIGTLYDEFNIEIPLRFEKQGYWNEDTIVNIKDAAESAATILNEVRLKPKPYEPLSSEDVKKQVKVIEKEMMGDMLEKVLECACPKF